MLPSAEEMSRHCLEPLRPELAAAARPGDIFCGREELWLRFLAEFAPACIAALGVRCIVAKSFARIFTATASITGCCSLRRMTCMTAARKGIFLTVEVNRCLKVNGQVIPIRQIPDNLFEIIKAGGWYPATAP